MRWALTGGSGFVGRALTRRLIDDGHHVRTLMRSGEPLDQRVEMIRGDIGDAVALRHLMADTEVVVHLASYVHNRASTKQQKSECRNVNVEGTRAVVSAVAVTRTRPFVVHISSANVYPASDAVLDERTGPDPRSFYGLTKLESERIVLDAVSTSSIRGCVLRPAMIFGRGAPGNLRRLIHMVRAGFMPIIGDGENAKSIVPIEDVVAAILTVVRDSASTNGEIYNVAGDEALPMRTIASIIADELHVRLRMVRLPRLPFVLAGRVLDVPARWLPLPDIAQLAETYASSSVISDWKLRQLPSWSRQTSTVAALRATARETADP